MRIDHVNVTVSRYVPVIWLEVVLSDDRLRNGVIGRVIGVIRPKYGSDCNFGGLLLGQPVPGNTLTISPTATRNRVRILTAFGRHSGGNDCCRSKHEDRFHHVNSPFLLPITNG